MLQRIATAARWRAYLGLARVARAPRRLDTPPPTVALTFDDGPDPDSTPRILDVLAEHGAVATFFCVGYRARRHPELVQRILAEGHVIGSHSDTHRVCDLTAAAAMADYAMGRRSVEDVVGRPVSLFRPPHGRLDVRTAVALRRTDMRTWLWTVDPRDYEPGTTAQDIVRAVGRSVAGDVVLLHDALEEAADDAPSRDAVVHALPEVITGMQQRGLTLVGLS